MILKDGLKKLRLAISWLEHWLIHYETMVLCTRHKSELKYASAIYLAGMLSFGLMLHLAVMNCSTSMCLLFYALIVGRSFNFDVIWESYSSPSIHSSNLWIPCSIWLQYTNERICFALCFVLLFSLYFFPLNDWLLSWPDSFLQLGCSENKLTC